MDHPFKVGERYTNRLGTYRVVAINPPKLRVEYDHGVITDLDLATQARIVRNMEQEREVAALPPPPPPSQRRRGRPPRAVTAIPPKLKPPPPTGHRRGRRPAEREKPQWSALREAVLPVRMALLHELLQDREAFLEAIDAAIVADRERYWVPPLAEVRTLNAVEPVGPTSPPNVFLAHSILHDRGRLADEEQEVLARSFPLNEAGRPTHRVDLLAYDTAAARPVLVAVRVRSTTVQWVWEALYQALEWWIGLRATEGFAAALGEYALTAPPGLGVLAPRATWDENRAGRTPAAQAAVTLNHALLAACRTWLDLPVLLLEVDDDWLRRVGTPGQPSVRAARLT